MYACAALISMGLCSCSEDALTSQTTLEAKATPMTFSVSYPGLSRATDSGFEKGDKIGLFVADATASLEIGGNLVNNEGVTYSGTAWASDRTLYWDDGTYNAYAYYPYMSSITSITDQPFTISRDQHLASTETALGGYEASDLLYASTKKVTASDQQIALAFKHIMSRLTINLVKGEDFNGEMPATAEVYIHNTVPEATIDLEAGVATKYVKGDPATIRTMQTGNYEYSAIVVPQRLSNRKPLIEVVMNGVSYLYTSTFLFKPGINHYVNIVISNNPEQIKIEIGGEIQGWN